MLKPLFWFFFIIIALYVVKYSYFILKFKNSNFKKESGVHLLKFLFDKGTFGEGLIFFELEKIKTYSKTLANVYLPTKKGTTELDLIYICTSGIYVLESKNYSGWIYGNEKYKNWTSVIYQTKNKFFNPIWQNNMHVKYLKEVLGDILVKSIIVFSDRCEFKKMSVGEHTVIKRFRLSKTIKKDLKVTHYTNEQIDSFYNELRKYSNQSDEVKQQHIASIREKVK